MTTVAVADLVPGDAYNVPRQHRGETDTISNLILSVVNDDAGTELHVLWTAGELIYENTRRYAPGHVFHVRSEL